MNNLKQLERLKKAHNLIKSECTGSPSELAKKLRISVRQTYLLLEQLRELDAPIAFNRRTKTYFYSFDYELTIHISVQVMVEDQLMNIYSGKGLSNYINSLQGSCSTQNYLCYIKAKLDVVG